MGSRRCQSDRSIFVRGLSLGLGGLLCLAGLGQAGPAQAQAGLTIVTDTAEISFPETVTFRLEVKSATDIKEVVLEYGDVQLTCGASLAKAFPDFEPGQTVKTEWAWEMKQSGTLPPGATIWWRWLITTTDGQELQTDKQTLIWLDDTHAWEVVAGPLVRLHWYDSDQAFAQKLHTAAEAALTSLTERLGMKPEGVIDLYIYASNADIQAAVLYEPDWMGGQAYAEHNIVIIGIAPEQLEWGIETEAHELTHVLAGRYTFSCLGFFPNWLVEGLAMYGENGPDETEQRRFDQAVADDTLFSVRALTGSFPEDADLANLAYTQSYSVVNFMVTEYGKDKLLKFLDQLRSGVAVEAALQAVYGFDTEGLEDAWRAAIQARPRTGDTENPTPTASPTAVPTIVPLSGDNVGVVVEPTRARPTATRVVFVPTRPPTPTPVGSDSSRKSPLEFALILCAGVGCVSVALIGVAAFRAWRPSRSRRKH